MTVAPGTFISSMLRYAGFVNAIWPSWLADRTFPTPEAARYPVITLPEVVALAPGTILLPSEPHPFTGDEAEALASEFAGLDPRFGRRVRIRRVDGELFSWYGSRMELALESFSTGLSETSSAAGRR